MSIHLDVIIPTIFKPLSGFTYYQLMITTDFLGKPGLLQAN